MPVFEDLTWVLSLVFYTRFSFAEGSYINQILSCVCACPAVVFCETFAISYEQFKYFFVLGSSHTTPTHLLAHTCGQKYNMHLKKPENSLIPTPKFPYRAGQNVRTRCLLTANIYALYLLVIFDLQIDFPYFGTEKLSVFWFKIVILLMVKAVKLLRANSAFCYLVTKLR